MRSLPSHTQKESLARLAASLLPLAIGLALSAFSCSSSSSLDPEWRQSVASYRAAADMLARRMDERVLAGQVIMAGVTGKGELPAWNRRFIEELSPGAVVLFGFNIPENPLELRPFLASVRAAAGGLPPFIAIDHEGGPVFRFKSGLTRLPAARDLGRAGESAASVAGAIAGGELAALGINLNLAPVVEAADDRNREFLELRAWADGYDRSGALAALFLKACQEEGTAGTLKHYPGNAAVDPHRGEAYLDATREELETKHLLAFRVALAEEPAAVVLSHVWALALDPDHPVTLSAPAIGLLKRDLGFSGIALTDDILMAGLGGEAKGPANAVAALAAGADMVMMSGGAVMIKARDAIVEAARSGELPLSRLRDAAARVLAQKLRFSLFAPPTYPEERDFARLVEDNRRRLNAALKR